MINFRWDHSENFFRFLKHPNYFPPIRFSGDYISMGYMLKGVGVIWHRYQGKEERIVLQEGDFFAFAPESILMNEIYEPENILLDVSMSTDVYKSYFLSAMGRGGLTEFMVNMVCQDTMPGYILFHTHADKKIRQLFYWAMLEHLQESEEAYDLVALYMELIFANIQKYHSQDAEMHFAGQRAVSRMPEFYTYLQANCADFSMEAMARHFHFSASYISRCFKRYAGKTIRDILIDMRMELAEKMLRDTDIGICEIAEQVGYQDPSYFIEAFKAKRQVTPFRFRKMKREGYGFPDG